MNSETVPRARVMSHGSFARDLAAIAVLKERGCVDRRLYAVTFDDFEGSRWFWLAAAERGERGWSPMALPEAAPGRLSENGERRDHPRWDLVRG